MKIRRSIGGLALGAALTLTGCDDIAGTFDDATIIVENNASVSVLRFYISECGDGTWGDDELRSNETISPGRVRRFGVREGCHDMRAEFSDASFAQEFDVYLDDGDEFTWELVD